jgi:beta-xylosidase
MRVQKSLLVLAAMALPLVAAAFTGCQMSDSHAVPAALVTSQLPPVYSPDDGPGRYRNPMVFADYSDPDVCRVGDDYYMTASSFSCFPGLPILHSRDLVHWTIIGHALPRYPAPLDASFNAPVHGGGVWAPSIRFHDGRFYIYFGDPDLGVFMTRAKNPVGPWEPLTRVKEAKGWIDTCPFWDEDGKAYLVHAFANSRAGIANVLDICRMAADGTRLLDEGTRIYDGGQNTRPAAAAFAGVPKYTTVEGPKFYKRNGYYYVMAPGGGVTGGYQIVFRAKDVLGPYESRKVLEQGTTRINGPHQGGWVSAAAGEDWFIHFQEILPYGRILHLQPLVWKNDWPVMGSDPDGDGTGEPVLTHQVPTVAPGIAATEPGAVAAGPQTSDEFDQPGLGLQWQWWANFDTQWASLTARPGYLRLLPVALDKATPLYNRPNLLLQKFPAEKFTVTTKLDVTGLGEGETAGLALAGKTMSSLTCARTAAGIKVTRTDYVAPANANAAAARNTDAETASVVVTPAPARAERVVYLRMKVAARGVCTFQFSGDGAIYTDLGNPVTAVNATWIGAKVGLFCNAPSGGKPKGYADFDYIHVEP